MASTSVPASLRECLIGLDCQAADAGQAWLVKLMHKEGAGIVRMLWRLLGNEQDVLDSYQDCICRLAVRGRLAPMRHLRAYAYKTAANIGIEVIRRRTRRQAHWPAIVETRVRSEEQPLSGAGVAERNEMIDRLREAVPTLPSHLRQVIVLRDLGERPYRDVARIMGIKSATARVYRRQAIVRLAEMLGEER